ncbi:MAG TPA: restriction endonuclease subunit M [Candidatus Aphodovivens excrementavium]|nr:restriction endonuclease subunit M [Candidatus Aphodovivens excrementavium]
MARLDAYSRIVSGTPQFRIVESGADEAPAYTFYTQANLDEDLKGVEPSGETGTRVKTFDSVVTASAKDVVFSLLSGTAAVVQARHEGFLLTQNYVKLEPLQTVDPGYLAYVLNENRQVRHQLRREQQGSVTVKVTLRQLRNLELPLLPQIGKQKLIGELYACQLKLDALRKKASELETVLVLEAIRKADES